MMTIMNTEFFGFDCAIGVNDKLSINITVDPQEFDLKSYRRSPFSSLVVDNGSLLLNNESDEKDIREKVSNIINYGFLNNHMIQYNLYSDNEYEKITSLFDDSRRFHTMIYTYDENKNYASDRRILIGAFPVKGIVSKISKSDHYKLYNGCFINCKPFYWNGDYYNKIVYILVDIQSNFNFQEFVKTDSDIYGLVVDHRFYIDYNDIVYKQCIYHIPYEGREELFVKPLKNIFYLSDVPKDIMMNRDNLIVKLK